MQEIELDEDIEKNSNNRPDIVENNDEFNKEKKEEEISFSDYLNKINFLIFDYNQKIEEYFTTNNFEGFEQVSKLIIDSIDIEKYPKFPCHNEETQKSIQIIFSLISNILENETEEIYGYLFYCLQVLNSLSQFIPNILDASQINFFLSFITHIFSNIKNNEIHSITIQTIGNVVDSTRDSAKVMKSLLYMLIDDCNQEDLVSNYLHLHSMVPFIKQLAPIGITKLKELVLPCIIKHLRIEENDQGQSALTTIYAAQILTDIVSSNYPGTSDLMMSSQIFPFVVDLIRRNDKDIVRQALCAMYHAINTLRCANIIVSDLSSVDFQRLLELMGEEKVSKEATLLFSVLFEKNFQTVCEINAVELMERALSLLDGAPKDIKLTLIHLIRSIACNSETEVLLTLPLTKIAEVTSNILELSNDEASAEILTAFIAIYIKLRSVNIPQEMLHCFLENNGSELLNECKESEFDELALIAQQMIELLHEDVPDYE